MNIKTPRNIPKLNKSGNYRADYKKSENARRENKKTLQIVSKEVRPKHNKDFETSFKIR